MVASIITTLAAGSAKPTGACQFGNKFFLCFEDQRPLVLMPGGLDGALKAYAAGIKPPTTAPTLGNHADDAVNLEGSTVYTIGYAFYSRSRVCFSQMSPTATITTAATAKKITVSGFEQPRDNATTNDIDAILVCVQSGTAGGMMANTNYTLVDAADHNLAAKSLTFDVAADDMELGFDFSQAEQYFFVPPAARYLDQHGERLWLGGQQKTRTMSATDVTVAKGVSYRGQVLAELTLSGEGVFDDSYLYYSAYVDGKYLGEVYDVYSSRVAYLDRDVAAAIAATQNFYFAGHNDRIWPTGFTAHAMGAVPTAYPETVNLLDYVTLSPVLDKGEQLQGIRKMKDSLALVFTGSVVQLAGGFEVDSPIVELRTDWGRAGAVAPRSICADGGGDLAWVGEEGICLGNTAGVATLAHELGCNQLFKGGRWIAATSLAGIVMAYSRALDGFVFGNLTINAETGWWGLLSLRPQTGIWLFSGQAITSNILEYADANGQGVLLAGDAYGGRVKRMLSPSTLLDVPAASDTAAAYTWRARAGWISKSDGAPGSLARVRLAGLIVPSGTCSLTLSIWRADYAQRHEDDIATADKLTQTLAQTDLIKDIPVAGAGTRRYWSIEISGASNTGATGTRALELARVQALFAEDGRR